MQGPDLLVYARDFSDRFFCEVKGPGDRLRPEQKSKLGALATVSGKPVRLLRLKWAPVRARRGLSLQVIALVRELHELRHPIWVSVSSRGGDEAGCQLAAAAAAFWSRANR